MGAKFNLSAQASEIVDVIVQGTRTYLEAPGQFGRAAGTPAADQRIEALQLAEFVGKTRHRGFYYQGFTNLQHVFPGPAKGRKTKET